MTIDIVLVLSLLAVSVVFLVSEWIPLEVTALLSLGALVVTGLLSPPEALYGFSNPAVVTVWAVFILSGGLTRTGVANVIGGYVLRLGGRSEILLTTAIVVSAGVMSAFMNNVAVAALMLPVIMDVSRQTDRPPSRLLMPLAYGSLLGGLTTLIGTPPNILVSDVLKENGLRSFSLFDYTPVGLAVMAAGTAFVVLVGRHLLPSRDVRNESPASGRRDLESAYDLGKRLFQLRLAGDSNLAGKTLAQLRLRSLLGLNVVAITRSDRSILAPSASEPLSGGDILMLEGPLERMEDVSRWNQLVQTGRQVNLEDLFPAGMGVREARPAPTSSLVGSTLNALGFRRRFEINVLAIRKGRHTGQWGFQDEVLTAGTVLLLLGEKDRLEALRDGGDFDRLDEVSQAKLRDTYRIQEHVLMIEVPEDSLVVGKTLAESRLGDALGMRVLSIARRDQRHHLPKPEERILAGDRLIVQGGLQSLEVLEGLKGAVPVAQGPTTGINDLESDDIGLMEAMLSPHTNLTGKTLRQLRFRDKYDLTVLAIWREGKAMVYDLQNLPLRFGDALLLHGKRGRFAILGQDPDFLVLTEALQDVPKRGKMKISVAVFASVILSVVLGFLPISVAAVIGAAFMVLTKCLTMEEAYRFIEWKAVFLIAGMLPLGVALDKTGAARFLAEGVVSLVGPFGPVAVMGGLVGLTFLATCFVPTSALVVLMAPIALKTSADMAMSPQALMMAVAMAASASFITPVSHPANILVMGPGGYRFLDFVKVGLPLTVIVFAVLMLAVPFFWPLAP